MTRDYPYTSEDLRHIADQVDKVMEGVGRDDLVEGDWRWGLSVDIYVDGGEDVAGQVKPYGDGWIGFYPKGLT